MTPDKLDLLLTSAPDRSLDDLEDAVWSRLRNQKANEGRLVRVASLQIGLFLAVVLGSAVVGGLAATEALARAPELSVFSPHSGLTPSTRLMGAAE